MRLRRFFALSLSLAHSSTPVKGNDFKPANTNLHLFHEK